MLANPFGVGFPRQRYWFESLDKDKYYYMGDAAGWRELYDGFVPDARIWKQIWQGLRRWWKRELINLGLMFVSPTPDPATRNSAATPTEA